MFGLPLLPLVIAVLAAALGATGLYVGELIEDRGELQAEARQAAAINEGLYRAAERLRAHQARTDMLLADATRAARRRATQDQVERRALEEIRYAQVDVASWANEPVPGAVCERMRTRAATGECAGNGAGAATGGAPAAGAGAGLRAEP